jgi:hypothetical protein
MNKKTTSALVLAAFLLGGCASMTAGPRVVAGDTMDAVRAQMGQPTAVYELPAGPEYEYASGPFGQRTWMVRFDKQGRVQSVEQVLTGPKFATIRVGEARKKDVLETLGRPAETSRVFLNNYEVWSYRYKENDVWNSMMHVHFDKDGVVRMMQNGPDRMFDERRQDF